MADVKMPESKPCRFEVPWRGPCGKPSTNGWCSEHEGKRCVSCGAKAERGCQEGLSLVCGAPLCKDCEHTSSRDSNGPQHVKRKTAQRIRKEREAEYRATITSRTSPTQRMNEKLGVPLNLFEFLKKPLPGFQLQKFYWLEVAHGLMGWFPAVFQEEHRVVMIADLELVGRVWKTMSPCNSKVGENLGYVSQDLNIVYPMIDDQEESKPGKLLTVEEFEDLLSKNEHPFLWAPGILGAGWLKEQWQFFAEFVDRKIAKLRVGAA
jgi:hypothetical protein